MNESFKTEDWGAVGVGLLVCALALLAAAGTDVLGWAVSTSVWMDLSQALAPVSRKLYAGLTGPASLFFTYLFLLGVMSVGAWLLGLRLRQFMVGFSVIFWISFLCWLLGHNAYIAATPDKLKELGIAWSLGLTGEAGFIVALVAGLIIGNVFPGAAGWLKEATRPEWYIKTAIVILGASLGIQAAEKAGLARAVLFRGLAAIVEAYLIYWALVYLIARKLFHFSREWAAPLASGISICGVSAAIATGAAIRARPIVPVMVSSLVVVFSVVELLILPFAAQTFLSSEPMVAGAWMGLAVKTDGAAVASGAVTEALIRARAADVGIVYEEKWMLMATTTVKVFIDVFIGIWAFVLALVWVYAIDKKPGTKVPLADMWRRFPKFVLGYFLTFLVLLGIALAWPGSTSTLKGATDESDLFRRLFFVMTFFTIGLVSNFKKLWQEGIARLALVYVVSLFGFVIWIGLAISWIFFHGVYPPVIPGSHQNAGAYSTFPSTTGEATRRRAGEDP
jgi:uncharacterized membrane protein YadS